MVHDPQLLQVVERFIVQLDQARIQWCVLRNHELFPQPRSITSDLDILIGCTPHHGLELLHRAIPSGTIAIGSVCTHSDGNMVGIFLCLPGKPSLHLDLIQSISWHGIHLVDQLHVLSTGTRVGSKRVARHGCEAAVSLLNYLFHQGSVKPEYRSRIQQLVTDDRSGFTACLVPVWGRKLSADLADHATAGHWEWFADWLKSAKYQLIVNLIYHPFSIARLIWRGATTMSRRILAPTGLWVAFMGPDGVGKTTLAEAYCTRLLTLFDTAHQRTFHWRPRFLPAPGKLIGQGAPEVAVDDPHGKPPRGQFISFLRFVYFCLDFVVGHFAFVRPLLVRRNLVCFDRCYHDFLLDPLRYRLRLPRWLILFVSHWVPKPELIFLLDAPVAILRARKQELQPKELEIQLSLLRSIATLDSSFQLVCVDRQLAETVSELERLTLLYLDHRNRRRLRLNEDIAMSKVN